MCRAFQFIFTHFDYQLFVRVIRMVQNLSDKQIGVKFLMGIFLAKFVG